MSLVWHSKVDVLKNISYFTCGRVASATKAPDGQNIFEQLYNKHEKQNASLNHAVKSLPHRHPGDTVRVQTTFGYNRVGAIKQHCKEP